MSILQYAIFAFVAGLVSFVSPCVLPLVPGYVSMISGVGLDELKAPQGRLQRRLMFNSIAFILGFSMVFIALGAAATGLGQVLGQYRSMLAREAGVLIILFGLHMTGLVTIKILYTDARLHSVKGDSTMLGAFLVGFAFAFGWTPCVGPILSVVLGFASAQATVWKGVSLLSIYALGLAVPFLATSMGIEGFLRFYNRYRKYMHATEIGSGVVLIALGELLVFDRFTLISNWLSFLTRFDSWLEKAVTQNNSVAIAVVSVVIALAIFFAYRQWKRPSSTTQQAALPEAPGAVAGEAVVGQSVAGQSVDGQSVAVEPAVVNNAAGRRNPLALVVVAVVVAGMLYFGLHMARRDGSSDAAASTARPAPDFTLESLDGKNMSLSDFRGKAVLLNFWATWCVPCKIEMPWFAELQKQYGSQGLQIVGVAMDDASKEDIAKFAKDLGVNYPVLIGKESVGDQYGGVPALPESFFISRDGKIVDEIIGLKNRADIEDSIKKALATQAANTQAAAR